MSFKINTDSAVKTAILSNIQSDDELRELEKSRQTKYFKREGSPGNYKYYYTEEEYKQSKGQMESSVKVGDVVHEKNMKHGYGTVIGIKNGQARVQFEKDSFDISVEDVVVVPRSESKTAQSKDRERKPNKKSLSDRHQELLSDYMNSYDDGDEDNSAEGFVEFVREDDKYGEFEDVSDAKLKEYYKSSTRPKDKGSSSTEDKISKARETLGLNTTLQKGKALPVGTINKHGEQKMGDGTWKYVGKKAVQEVIGSEGEKNIKQFSKEDLKKLEISGDQYKSGPSEGKNTAPNLDTSAKITNHIENKLKVKVSSIISEEKGVTYPHNRSNPYRHDIYKVKLANGQTVNITRQYGRPAWEGHVSYTERIIVQ